MSSCQLRDPSWDDLSALVSFRYTPGFPSNTYGIDETDANTTDHSPTDGHVAASCTSLQAATKQNEYAPKDNGTLPPEAITESTSNEAAEHGTEIVGRNQTSLFGGVGHFAVRSANTHGMYVTRCRIHKAHDTLVISFKDQSHCREQIERPQEEPPGHGPPWFECHSWESVSVNESEYG